MAASAKQLLPRSIHPAFSLPFFRSGILSPASNFTRLQSQALSFSLVNHTPSTQETATR